MLTISRAVLSVLISVVAFLAIVVGCVLAVYELTAGELRNWRSRRLSRRSATTLRANHATAAAHRHHSS
jgi:hypothetical protein